MIDFLIIIIIAYFILSYVQQGGVDMQGGEGYSSGIIAMSEAIAFAEGFYIPGTIPYRANNPGDLTAGDVGDTGQYIIAAGGIKIIAYPDANTGWNALYTKLQHIVDGLSHSYNPNMTLSQFARTYSGSSDGSWLNNVISKLGVDSNTSIGDILNA